MKSRSAKRIAITVLLMVGSGLLFAAQLWEHSRLSFELASRGLTTDQTRSADRLFSCFLMGNLVLTLVTIGVLEHVWSRLDKRNDQAEPGVGR